MRTAFTALSIGLGLLVCSAASPALADGFQLPHVQVQVGQPQYQYGYQPGYQPGYRRPFGGGPRWQNPGFFSARMNERMQGIEQDLREHVNQGWVAPRALDEFYDRRSHIQEDINSAAADGVITPWERNHVLQNLDQLRTLSDRFRVNNGYGGGPGWRHDWR